jgi:hypothetical protein
MINETWLNGELSLKDEYGDPVIVEYFDFKLDSVIGVVQIATDGPIDKPFHVNIYLKGVPTPFDIKLRGNSWNTLYYYMYPEQK